MPAPKRTSTSKPAAKRTAAATRSGAKATTTSARKAGGRTATQAKSGASKTASSAKSAAAKTKSSAQRSGASAAAKTAGREASTTAKTARAGAKGTATAATRGAKRTRTTAKGAATKTKRATGSDGGGSLAEQLAKGTLKPQDVLVLTRQRVQEALDDAAARGRVTRKDANDLVSELVKRGKSHGDEFRKEFDSLVGRGREGLETASKRARKAPGADRIVREADRARRAAGVGPSFPILGYDELNASQIQSRIGDLSKADQRKVLTYERSHANRKSVTGPLEKAIG